MPSIGEMFTARTGEEQESWYKRRKSETRDPDAAIANTPAETYDGDTSSEE